MDQEPDFVVGIGASAGGLEAVERMFDRMPLDSGMAYVLVQHLSPGFQKLDGRATRSLDRLTHSPGRE